MDDPNFDPDDFGSGLFNPGDRLDALFDQAQSVDDDEVGWASPVSEFGVDRTVFDANVRIGPATIPDLSTTGTGAVTTSVGHSPRPAAVDRTVQRELDQQAEAERIRRALDNESKRLSRGPAGVDERGYSTRRHESTGETALEYARKAIAANPNFFARRDGTVSGDNTDGTVIGATGPTELLPTNSRTVPQFALTDVVTNLRASFRACTFRATFDRLATSRSGEWMLTLRTVFEDNDAVKSLDKAHGITLVINVHREEYDG